MGTDYLLRIATGQIERDTSKNDANRTKVARITKFARINEIGASDKSEAGLAKVPRRHSQVPVAVGFFLQYQNTG